MIISKKYIYAIAIITLILAVYFIFQYVNNSKAVYIVSSLPGFHAQVTKEQMRGIQMAFEEAKYKAGKYTVNWLPMNDSDNEGWSALLEENNAKRAVNNETIVAYYGPYNSGATKITLPILNESGMLQYTVSTWPGLTKSGYIIGEPLKFYPKGHHNMFRLIPNDAIQGKVVAIFLKKNKIKNFAIIHDGRVYGKGISLIVKNEAESLGINSIYTGIVPGDDVVEDVVNNILKNNPEAVFVGSDVLSGVVKTYVSLRQKGYKGVVVGTEFSDTSMDSGALPDDYNLFTVIPGVPVKNMKNQIALSFYDEYLKRYKEEPSQFALFANQSIKLILKSIENSDGTRASVLEESRKLFDIETAYGPVRFDDDGDTMNNESSILHMVRGKWDFVESIKIGN